MKFSKSGNENGGGDYRYDRELPNGIYDADVLATREDKSKNQNDMIVISLGVEGPHGGVKVDEYIVSFFLPKVESMIHSLSPEHSEVWDSTGECDLNPMDLVGRSCRVEIKNEEWEGKQKPKVSKMMPIEL